MLKQTADTFLDQPIDISIGIKPQSKIHALLQRFRIRPNKKVFRITGPTLRTMMRISRLLADIKFAQPKKEDSVKWGYDVINSEAERMADIIAIAIHNRKEDRPQDMVDFILDNMEAEDLRVASQIIINRLNVADFISSIASVRTMDLLSEASPQEPEIIAEQTTISGEPSEELQNIFAGVRIT